MQCHAAPPDPLYFGTHYFKHAWQQLKYGESSKHKTVDRFTVSNSIEFSNLFSYFVITQRAEQAFMEAGDWDPECPAPRNAAIQASHYLVRIY